MQAHVQGCCLHHASAQEVAATETMGAAKPAMFMWEGLGDGPGPGGEMYPGPTWG